MKYKRNSLIDSVHYPVDICYHSNVQNLVTVMILDYFIFKNE